MNDYRRQKCNKNNLGIFQKFSLLMYFIVVSNPDLNNSRVIWWGIFGFVLLAFLLYIYINNFSIKKIKIKYITWNILFISFSIASSLWAIDSGCSFEIIKKMLIRSIVLWFVSILCTEKADFFEVLKLFTIANAINFIYIFYTIDLTTLGNMRIGAGSLGEEWNANDIGMTMAFSAFIAYFLFKNQKNKKGKFLYSIAITFFAVIVLFTGSKKALFIFIFAPLFLYYITSRNKIRATFLMLLGGVCLLYFVMNIPSLYSVIGRRIKSFLSYFIGSGNVDRSTLLRIGMIDYGFLWFKERPILGYGINNYSKLYGSITGWYTYSHNNYIELLVGVGIIGTVIYYSSYLYLIKNALGKKNLFSAFAFVLIITIMITEIGLVSYVAFYIQLLICFGFSAILIAEQEGMNNE